MNLNLKSDTKRAGGLKVILYLRYFSPPLSLREMPRVRSRNWCFTIFIHDEDGNNVDRTTFNTQLDEFMPINKKIDEAEYLVYQYEFCPRTERLHIQGYMQFVNSRSLGGVKKLLTKWSGEKGPHLEIANGTPEENRTYCTKLESRAIGNTGPFEFGDCPVGDVKTDMVRAWEMFRDGGGRITTELTHKYLNYVTLYGKKWKEIYEDLKYENWVQREIYSPPEVIVLWGATGTGKSRKALDEGAMSIHANLAWPFAEYRGQKTVVFDDYRGEFSIGYFLKLIDGHAMTVPLMYVGNKPWVPTKIYITSNKHPKEWYPKLDGESYNAMTRRFTKMEYFPKPVEHVGENIEEDLLL